MLPPRCEPRMSEYTQTHYCRLLQSYTYIKITDPPGRTISIQRAQGHLCDKAAYTAAVPVSWETSQQQSDPSQRPRRSNHNKRLHTHAYWSKGLQSKLWQCANWVGLWHRGSYCQQRHAHLRWQYFVELYNPLARLSVPGTMWLRSYSYTLTQLSAALSHF